MPRNRIDSDDFSFNRCRENGLDRRFRIDRPAEDLWSIVCAFMDMVNVAIIAVQNFEAGYILIKHRITANDDTVNRQSLRERDLQELVQVVSFRRPTAATLITGFRFKPRVFGFEGVSKEAAGCDGSVG